MKKSILKIVLVFIIVGCDDILEVPDISNETVSLIAPSEGAIVQGNTTTFSWQPVADAEEYSIQVATPNFNEANQVIIDSIVRITSFTRSLLPNTYEWRIKALNSGFETSYTANNFTVLRSEGLSGNTLILESPRNNFATNETDITLSWQAIEGATEYRVQILENNGTIVFDEAFTETTADLTFSEGSFNWQVRAENATENTLFSSRNIIVDITDPNAPVLDSPANNGSINTNDVDFNWIREDIPGSRELDSIFIYSDMSLQNLVARGQSLDRSFTTNLESDTYFWIVQAFDDAGNESRVSATRTFTVN
ncbi:hypothetical protein GTQ40_13700 [Flavobacteriaceae bacterium R38]|nr:hypothetical protein [Flavobacteriaceae bacterium R38]